MPKSPAAAAPSSASVQTTSRSLSDTAVYADLVRAAAMLDGKEEPTARCLLGPSPQGFAFEAEVRSALRPLPQPPQDLDELLAQTDSAAVLSPWGRYGRGGGPLTLVAFTDSPPMPNAVALVLTDRGVSVRAVGDGAPLRFDELDLDAALTHLPELASTNLLLTAEARVPLAEVLNALERVTGRASVVTLAVSLEAGIPLPPPLDVSSAQKRCPEGLEETAALEGDLPMEELARGVAPLREQAADCLQRANARGAAGGRLTLALRIDARGDVSDACIVADETDDVSLEACILELTRQLHFAAPSPAGVVDAELPLVLQAHSAPAQRTVCQPTL